MSMRRFTGALGLAALLLVGACAPTKVQSVQSYTADVTLDSGIGARVKSAIMGAPANQETLDARKVTDAISQTLVKEIDKLG